MCPPHQQLAATDTLDEVTIMYSIWGVFRVSRVDGTDTLDTRSTLQGHPTILADILGGY